MKRRGFTLVEVMLALAILGMGLVILVKSVAGNASSAGEAFYMGIATDLARGKMYDLEEQLLDEGFQDDVQEENGDFDEEGWPGITWSATIEPAELPSYEQLMGMGQQGAGSGSGEGGEGEPGEPSPEAMDKFQSSALGGMLSMFGGGGGDEGGGTAKTGAFLQGQYQLVQQVLKASIRKISLTVKWNTGLRKEEMKIILYVTDPAGMQKTLGAFGL